jgi:hypothetical protein
MRAMPFATLSDASASRRIFRRFFPPALLAKRRLFLPGLFDFICRRDTRYRGVLCCAKDFSTKQLERPLSPLPRPHADLRSDCHSFDAFVRFFWAHILLIRFSPLLSRPLPSPE